MLTQTMGMSVGTVFFFFVFCWFVMVFFPPLVLMQGLGEGSCAVSDDKGFCDLFNLKGFRLGCYLANDHHGSSHLTLSFVSFAYNVLLYRPYPGSVHVLPIPFFSAELI
jgi:hypothetical protein